VFTPDGKLLASLGDSGALRIEEVASGTEILRQQFPRDILATLAMSPDGSMLAVAPGANNRKLYVWKWQAGEEPRELKVGDFTPFSLSFSPDGKLLAATGDRGTTVLVWDVASGRPVHRLDIPDPGHVARGTLAFSPDGKTLATTSFHGLTWEGAVHLWDPATGKHQGRF